MSSYSTSSDWGGDYSYLLHSIEGRLSSQIPSSTTSKSCSSISSLPDENSQLITTRKRLRLSDDNNVDGKNILNQFMDENIDGKALKDDENEKISRSYVFKLKQKIEELKLTNDEYKDKYESCKHESKHSSEKYIRQLTFAESEIQRLQKSLDEKNEKYYDEKKKWQAKIRSLENQVEKLEESLASLSSVSSKSSKVTGILNVNPFSNMTNNVNDHVEEWKEKYSTLKNEFDSYKKETKKVVNDLEEKVKDISTDSKRLKDLQDENVELLMVQSELENNMTELRRHLLSAETMNNILEKEKSELAVQVQGFEGKLLLAQHQTRLYEGEVKSLRALLGSYETEFKIGRPDAVKMNKLREETIAKLRTELDTIRQESSVIATKAISLSSSFTLKPSSLDESQSIDKITEYKSRITSLESEVEKYKGLYEGLQNYTRTDVLPGYNQVLHLASNPYSQAITLRNNSTSLVSSSSTATTITESTIPIDELHRLRREIKQLKATSSNNNISIPKSSSDSPEDTLNTQTQTTVDNSSNSSSSSNTTTNQLDSNKLNQRLKEMFKDRITSFREAVYLLTGYKVDLYTTEKQASSGTSDGSGNSTNTVGESKRLRLRSMYAESPEDSLLFQWTGETLELLETPFASKIDPKLFSYLNSYNSVPAFLANVTIELFDNQTFMG